MENINILSTEQFPSGEYNKIDILGTGKCSGNLVCCKLNIPGTMKIDGFTQAEFMSVYGTLKCDGDIEGSEAKIFGTLATDGSMKYEKLHIPGTVKTEGDLNACKLTVLGTVKCRNVFSDTIKCLGTLKAQNDLKACRIEIDGSLKSAGKIEAEAIFGRGTIKCQTQISADRIEICGKVTADEIVGDHIEIKRQQKGLIEKIKSHFSDVHSSGYVCANLIEATTVVLEDVRANVVSGENIIIGPGCQIDRLECTGTYKIDPSSVVHAINGEPYMS